MPALIPQLERFIAESNRIEGINRDPTVTEGNAHIAFLALPHPTVPALVEFVREVAGAELRDKRGHDVRVGGYIPPRGGPQVAADLAALLFAADKPGAPHAHEVHVAYEQLHPFMDGNGRSGRVLWAWQMLRDGQDPFALSFLHRFYYQTLDASR